MNLRKSLAIFVAIGMSAIVHGQNVVTKQRELQNSIQSAFQHNQLTELEYKKLMDEQASIRYAIEKYQSDGYFTRDEKNKVNSKLIRARKRLMKYRHNREVY